MTAVTSNKIVTTYNGMKAERKRCRYIKGNFYIMNKQCFKIVPDGKWYRINSGMIFFNHNTGNWEKKGNYMRIANSIVIDNGEFKRVDLGIFKKLTPSQSGENEKSYKYVWLLIPIKLDSKTINEFKQFFLNTKFREDALKRGKMPNDITNLLYSSEFINFLFSYNKKLFLKVVNRIAEIFNIDWDYIIDTRIDPESIKGLSYEEIIRNLMLSEYFPVYLNYGVFDSELMKRVLPDSFKHLIDHTSILSDTLYVYASFKVVNTEEVNVNKSKYKKLINVDGIDSSGYVSTIGGDHDDVPDSKEKRLLYTFLAKCMYFYKMNGDQFYDDNLNIAYNVSYCQIPYNRVYKCGNIGEVQYTVKPLMKRFSIISKSKKASTLPDVHFVNSNVKDVLNNFGFSVGIEYETSGGIVLKNSNRFPVVFSRGVIPENELFESGLLPTRDGSISGIEYVSVPMKNNIPKLLNKQLKTLRRHTSITVKDSLHVHIGNIPHLDYQFVVAMYKLGIIIENDIYKMFPSLYKRTSEFKRRDYNNPLLRGNNNGNELFNPKVPAVEKMVHIYKWLGGDMDYAPIIKGDRSKDLDFDISQLVVHPADPEGTRKWHINGRYTWCNFVPLIWNLDSYKTLEFRIHVPTFSINKIIYWLLIIRGIVLYADKYKVELFHLEERNVLGRVREKLKFIISQIYTPDVAELINSYIDWRNTITKNDERGEVEIYNYYEVPENLKLVME